MSPAPLGAGGGGGGGGVGAAAGSTKKARTAEVGLGQPPGAEQSTTRTNTSTMAWMARDTGGWYDCFVL
jgi:hypothetical protein